MLAATLLAATVLGALSLGAGTATAWAETKPAPTMTPGPFAITAPVGGFSPANTVTFTGTMSPGSTVSVSAGSLGCTAPPADASATDWACQLTLPNGPALVVTATETLQDSTPGDQATVTLDVLGPPTVTASPAQQSPGVARGTGYPGSTITLLVNSASQPCTAPVAGNGTWLCTVAGGAGTFQVQATQTVTAMGTSNPSNQRTIVVNPAPPVETPDPVVTPPAPQPAPVLPPPPTPTPSDEPEPAPTPTPSERADAGTLPWLDRPIFPSPSGTGPTIGEALTNWGTPTGFGSKLPTPTDTFTGGNWAWAPLFALAFIALVAIPLRLLAEALRGRLPQRSPRLAGRNRNGEPVAEPTPRNPWLMGAVPLAATAGLIALAEGLNGEARYLRLLFAVGAGLAILNVIGVAIATRLSSRQLGVSGRLRFMPILLVIAAIATVIARVTGMEPPLVGGVLIGTAFAMGVSVRPRAIVNLCQVGGVLALAVLAWLAHSVIGPVDGFWASVLVETLATVCLAGLGSALMLMLPIGALPGRVVLEWSRGAWVASTAVVGTVTAALLMGGVQTTFPTLAVLLTVAGFAAVSIAVWAWSNYARVSRA